jgi:hypothetical protein
MTEKLSEKQWTEVNGIWELSKSERAERSFFKIAILSIALRSQFLYIEKALLPCGVIGNTSDSGSEESRFDSWRGSQSLRN